MRDGSYQGSSLRGEGGLSGFDNISECSMARLWVGDVGSYSWGMRGFGPKSAGSLMGKNSPPDDVSLWYLSIGLLSVVRGSFRTD